LNPSKQKHLISVIQQQQKIIPVTIMTDGFAGNSDGEW
jgi:hypothetical protein